MDDDTKNKDYKYILIDNSDPLLMWNCAVSILVFLLLLLFIFMNWKPKCSNTNYEDMTQIFDVGSIEQSLGDTDHRYI